MATIDTLCAAAVTALNAHDFGVTFTAVQQFLPRIERRSMGSDWHVWIVTADLKANRQNRKRSRRESSFDVALLKLLPDTQPATVNPCLAFADAVQGHFDEQLKRLDDHDLIAVDFDPLYSESHLKQETVFLSVLALTYRRS